MGRCAISGDPEGLNCWERTQGSTILDYTREKKGDKSDQDNNNVGDLSSIYESILVMLKSVRVHVSA